MKYVALRAATQWYGNHGHLDEQDTHRQQCEQCREVHNRLLLTLGASMFNGTLGEYPETQTKEFWEEGFCDTYMAMLRRHGQSLRAMLEALPGGMFEPEAQ